jgi:hypothetical protein
MAAVVAVVMAVLFWLLNLPMVMLVLSMLMVMAVVCFRSVHSLLLSMALMLASMLNSRVFMAAKLTCSM